jgi:hypothetical protein
MGLTLRQALAPALPAALLSIVARAASPLLRPVYADGSFAVTAPLLAVLSLSPTALARKYSTAATGVYLPASGTSPHLPS